MATRTRRRQRLRHVHRQHLRTDHRTVTGPHRGSRPGLPTGDSSVHSGLRCLLPFARVVLGGSTARRMRRRHGGRSTRTGRSPRVV
jgi:hypothetical protein